MTFIDNKLKEFETWLNELDEQELLNSREGIVKFFRGVLEEAKEQGKEEMRSTAQLLVNRDIETDKEIFNNGLNRAAEIARQQSHGWTADSEPLDDLALKIAEAIEKEAQL